LPFANGQAEITALDNGVFIPFWELDGCAGFYRMLFHLCQAVIAKELFFWRFIATTQAFHGFTSLWLLLYTIF
jgi:hypothetical protein